MTSHRFKLIPNLALGLALVLSSAVGAKASNIGYTSSNAVRDDINGVTGLTYAFRFTPNQNIIVDSLGVYNNGENLNDAHDVGLWLDNNDINGTGTLITSVTVPAGACSGPSLVSSSNFCLFTLPTPISLISLPLGQSYVVGAYYPDPAPSNPNPVFDSFFTNNASDITPTPGITLIPTPDPNIPITQGLKTLFNVGPSLAFPNPSDPLGNEKNGIFFSSANFSFTLDSGGGGGGGGGTNIPEPSFVNAFLVFALVGWLNRKKSASVSKK